MSQVNYTVPTTRTDGSPLPLAEIETLRFQHRVAASADPWSADQIEYNPLAAGSFDYVLPTAPGSYEIRSFVYDTAGRVSGFSNVVVRSVAPPIQPPSPPVLS